MDEVNKVSWNENTLAKIDAAIINGNINDCLTDLQSKMDDDIFDDALQYTADELNITKDELKSRISKESSLGNSATETMASKQDATNILETGKIENDGMINEEEASLLSDLPKKEREPSWAETSKEGSAYENPRMKAEREAQDRAWKDYAEKKDEELVDEVNDEQEENNPLLKNDLRQNISGFVGGIIDGALTVGSQIENKLSSYKYNESDANLLKSMINTLIDPYTIKLYRDIRYDEIYNELCNETKKNVGDLEKYVDQMKSLVTEAQNLMEAAQSRVVWGKRENKEIDSRIKGSSSGNQHISTITPTPTPTPTTPDPTTLVTPINQNLINAAFGLVTFIDIVPLYESLGASNTVNSTDTTTYGLLGIIQYNGEYYYKIIDKATGNIYFTEISNKVQLDGTVKNVLIIKSSTYHQDTNELNNENNNATIVNDGIYLVKSIESVQDGISFVKILDPNDGKDYYIPQTEAIEVVDIDSLGINK